MKIVSGLLVRLIVAFLVVGGILYIFVLSTQRTATNTINSHVRAARSFSNSLQTAHDRMKNLESPSVIMPAQKGARQFANKINEAKGSFSSKTLTIPSTLDSLGQNERVIKFNEVVGDPLYRDTTLQATQALRDDQLLLTYHGAVMLALANLLEYNPSSDLSSGSSETLTQNLSAAQAGLQVTIDRLGSVPKYQPDQNLTDLIAIVSKLEPARAKLSSAIDTPDFSKEKSAFITVIHKAQGNIIANRSNFWSQQSIKLIAQTATSIDSLNVYYQRLNNL